MENFSMIKTKEPGDSFSVFALGSLKCRILFKKKNKFCINLNIFLKGNMIPDLSS